MTKTRLEAFSDGVIAIIITIMVLELKVPHESSIDALIPMIPIFLSYVLSFVHVGIYWNNHHHLFHASSKVNGAVLWANLHLLFWLSLVPFATAWMGENHFPSLAVAFYGLILLFSGVAYYILSQTLISHHGKESTLSKAVGKDAKGVISLIVYCLGVILSFWYPMVAMTIYVVVAGMWLLPDRRIEKVLNDKHSS